MTVNIEKSRAKLNRRILAIVDITQGLNEIFPIVLKKLNKSKRNMLIRILNQSIQSIVLLFFRPKYKKILLGVKTGIGVTRKILKV